jgi:alkylation response protein AidB-like acyl-CoA dehydrogenase
VGAAKRELAALQALAARTQNGRPLLEDPRFRDRLSRTEIELQALEITSMRFLDQMRRSGQPPGADVSMLKIRGTEVQQMITELMMQAAGPQAAPFKAGDAGARSTPSPPAWRRATSTSARPASTPGPTRSSATSSPR